MMRSMAPSQLRQQRSSAGAQPAGMLARRSTDTDTTTIQTMPLFGFLSIPDSMKRQFKVPSGCEITEASVALRKVKTLGGRKSFEPLRPSGVAQFKRISPLLNDPADEEDEELQGVGTVPELPPFEPLVLWEAADGSHKIEVIPELACKLRPHQREGVQFLFECTMGQRGFDGEGCILADDMGLGKTLMSITLLWTLLNQGFSPNASAVRKAVVVCPTSLVGNWDNELRKWIGTHCPTFAVKSEPKKCIRNFVQHRGKGVLIVSYETQRRYSKLFASGGVGKPSTCELLICDEAHKLKNASSGLAISLNTLPARKRILLSGTPMQNELTEFFNMVNFCNPGVLGTHSEFRKRYERPILQSRERDASAHQIANAGHLQKELSTIVNEFILKRGNILNAQHLPPKLVQYVCCELTPLQDDMYDKLLSSKECRHILDGRNSNALNTIRYMINICSHPDMIVNAHKEKLKCRELDHTLAELAEVVAEYDGGDRMKHAAVEMVPGEVTSLPEPSRSERCSARGIIQNRFPINKSNSSRSKFRPELSGKFYVLYRMMETLRAMRQGDRIVIVSNFTSTLDLVEAMCSDNGWPQLRLDGTTAAAKRTKLVDTFNDPTANAFAFLLSSKAGGCGINLIGGNRLVLFDPDWNPASDKQAAARIWREGQKKRCFIYRFMSTSTIEEKIIQRQLSKEGLTSIVDNKDQVNTFSSKELKDLFKRRKGTRSDTHDTLRCTRCKGVSVLPGASATDGGLPSTVMARCSQFIQDYHSHICSEAAALELKDIDISDLNSIRNELQSGAFSSLPDFSRKLRNVVRGVSENEQESGLGFNIYEEFVSRWTELVPALSALSAQSSAAVPGGAGDDEDEEDTGEECVEQDGCPEEEDFNKWSHHCSVRTCDDEALRRAMGDDTSVSFVFGLEVNWTLLQARQAERQEEEEMHRQQLKQDLAKLNQRRRRTKAVLEGREDISSNDEISDDGPNIRLPKARHKQARDNKESIDDSSGDSSDDNNSLGSFIAQSESDEAEMESDSGCTQQLSVVKSECSALASVVKPTVAARCRVLSVSDEEPTVSDGAISDRDISRADRTARSNVLAKCEKRSPSDRNGVSVVKKQRIVSRDEGKTAEVLMPLRDISNTDPSPASCLDKPKAGLSQGSEGSKRSVTLIDWNCDLCTYLNSKRAIKCQMCGFKK